MKTLTNLNLRLAIGLTMAMIALALSTTSSAQAQSVSYMQMPASGSFGSPTTFTLPGYGSVQVAESTEPAAFFDQTNAYNKSAGTYTWGTDTQRLNVLNTSRNYWDYTVTFNFLSGAPDLSRLLMIPVGLASTTTAVVSEQGGLVGEYNFGGITSATLYNSGTKTFTSQNNADPKNTGWALFQFDQADGPFTSVSLDWHQESGDGTGFTLGYVSQGSSTPEPNTLILLGSSVLGLGGFLRRRLLG